jgi:hypothetical protein
MGMNITGKIALGASLASSFLLAAWLLTGERKMKAKDFVTKKAESLRSVLKSDKVFVSELDDYYI